MYVISRALAKFISINRSDILLSATYAVSCRLCINLESIDLTDLFFVHMPTMMWALDHGLLDLMWSMLMRQSFVVHLGRQVSLSILVYYMCMCASLKYTRNLYRKSTYHNNGWRRQILKYTWLCFSGAICAGVWIHSSTLFVRRPQT